MVITRVIKSGRGGTVGQSEQYEKDLAGFASLEDERGGPGAKE